MKEKLIRILIGVGAVVLVLVIIRYSMFKTWTLPEDGWTAASVAPTLWGGDTVLLLTAGTPGMGDLVRCADPEIEGEWVVGRIVGMGGDEVDLKGRTLRINGTNNDGVWNTPEQEAWLTVNVQSPPWLRWWAWALYAFGGSVLLFGFLHWRLMASKRQRILLQEEVDARTAELSESEEKSRLLLESVGEGILAWTWMAKWPL